MEEAHVVYDHFKEGEQLSIVSQESLARICILALWIHRSPQQRQKWNKVCKIINLSSKYIEYDVDIRWNSTFRILVIPIYYKLYDLLDEASERKERFLDLDEDISLAVKEGIKKYKKYYTFMDASDTYYTALILDPRVKGDLLLDELEDEATRREILKALHDNLHRDYSVATMGSSLTIGQSLLEYNTNYNDVESRLLKRLQPLNQPLLSDIDHYLISPQVNINN
ncbi:hypothetical protein TSTA_088170 [Talaromyces stipitatus ATCC 10500]|uniref:Uncharacterized protein n=1 Tax=Talaromyces stipitatus (strain ATCC 10500 / CBS 375.48 / QM 6759 / NRRL 1006) TaxID=441959 RepID=B8M2B7_TALSN|nr:uncharacterized protein TSTA_088170 [Talaromyces stipitatus ATCC 10500]EED21581.1 hypothetical protein TSTA_088170 [Talaromyces stipitatus ATCC 10500]